MTKLEADITAWLAEGLRIESKAFDDVTAMARDTLRDFWDSYPDHRTEDLTDAMHQLEVMARVAGFEVAQQFIGSAVVCADGGMVLEIKPHG